MSTTTLQDQFTTFARQGQEAALAAVDVWTRSITEAAVRVPSAAVQAASQQAIDETFDLVLELVGIQRSLAKEIATSSVTAAEDFANNATRVAAEATTKLTQG
jgi:hypothetical protein